MSACDMGGARVLVTRPSDQSVQLVKALAQIGARATVFPGVRIVELASETVKARLARLSPVDLLIFVSPTAVRLGLKAIAQSDYLPGNAQIAAVGPGTAAEFKKNGVHEIILPLNGSGGDALAACEELRDISGRSIVIVRGEGGRDSLAAILRERGAQVSFLECYRREFPDSEFAEIGSLLRDNKIVAWTATSGEILDNLFRMAGNHSNFLQELPLFVNHPNVAVSGFSKAVRSIFVAKGGDAGLAAGIASWFCGLSTESTNSQFMQ